MGKRILSAAVGLPLLVAAVVVDRRVFAGVVALAAGVGAWEFYRLAHKAGARPFSRLGMVFSVLLAVGLEISWSLGPRFPLFFNYLPLSMADLLPLALLLSWGSLLLRKDKSQAAADWAWTMAGILYPGLLLSYWVFLRMADPQGYLVLVGVFATFAADTGAFLVGRLWGRRPLAPEISPGKTWEGAGGGWISAVAVAILMTAWLAPALPTPPQPRLTPLMGAILGGLVGIVGPVGDLAESLLKRSVGAKDSGALIPGHGGVLDRLDSLLFTGPVIYFYVSLLMVGNL